MYTTTLRGPAAAALRCTALAMLFFASACTGGGPRAQSSLSPIRGQALDVETGQPLAEVHVIARYIGTNGVFAHSEDVCRRVEYIKTGVDGYFRFPAGEPRNPQVTAYKAGYQAEPRPFFFDERLEIIDGKEQWRFYVFPRDPKARAAKGDTMYPTREAAMLAAGSDNKYFKRFTGSAHERFAQLWPYISGTSCDNGGERNQTLVRFLEAVHAEMATLAASREELDQLRSAAHIIELERKAR